MAGINKVILVGNLGKDPEVRTLESGAVVAKFPLATTESYRNKNGERVETTEWHNIVIWRGLAEIAEKYLRKGSRVFVEGKIRTRSWEDKDGNKKYITEIEADNMMMLDTKSTSSRPEENTGSGGGMNSSFQETNSPVQEPGIDDDLPF